MKATWQSIPRRRQEIALNFRSNKREFVGMDNVRKWQILLCWKFSIKWPAVIKLLLLVVFELVL